MKSSNKSVIFGNLLKGAINGIANYEDKTAPIIEEELGALIGVSGKTIQRYKSGHLPPVERDNDAVRILAEAAVRRGFLGRAWLERFLRAARYPAAEKLLDELCPALPARPKPERVYENLPAPTYDQFVMRQQAFAEVIDGLGQRSAAVLIVGLGGNGKTSLAREVAAQCLHDDCDAPHFDAVVWVSDKDNPGTTNQSTVLDTIARTLDYPGFTQFSHDEKQYEVEQLLRRQKVLLIIDNAETITDGALFSWLLRLPEPSKAIITTREYQRAYRRGGWPVELRGMSEAEAGTLLQQRLERLRISHLVHDPAQLEPVLVATGGNPKAITLVAGLLKYERRPLQQIVDDLYAARGDLFDDLFSRAWALLDEVGKRILMVMTFFPDSASSDALSTTANVTGFDFDRAVERLSDLSLLDVQQTDVISQPRYMLHPLVRAFAAGRLATQSDLEQDARERMINWCVELAESWFREIWEHPKALELLNAELGLLCDDLKQFDDDHEIFFLAAQEAFQEKNYLFAFQIARALEYYYYLRGFWEKKVWINQLYIQSADFLGYKKEEIRMIAYHIQLLSKRGSIEDANQYLEKLSNLSSSEIITPEIQYCIQHARTLHACSQQDWTKARWILESSLENDEILPNAYIVHRLWLGICLYHMGLPKDAYELLLAVSADAEKRRYPRMVMYSNCYLIAVYLDQRDLTTAAMMLEENLSAALKLNDREVIAMLKKHFVRLFLLSNEFAEARNLLVEAIDIFSRLGMRRELAEARAELARLEAGEVSEA
jgi:hypothetical protein